MTRILLLGTIPPPIGGVTIHLDRFFNLFKDSRVFELSILDLKKKTLFIKNRKIRSFFKILIYFMKINIVHIHISNNYIKVFFAFISKLLFKKVIYTHHNSLVKNKFIFKVMFKLCDRIILVNDKEISANLIIAEKTEVIPAFLPPYKIEKLPYTLEEEIKKFDKVISTNCYLYNLINSKHVYGFDLIIEAFSNLSRKGQIKNTLLVLVDPSSTTKEFVNSLLEGKDFKTNKVLHVTDKVDFIALVKRSDITIRATRTDGDSLSIRESLYFNIPIIASDVTIRPEGTVLFKSDDSGDLEDKILELISCDISVTDLNTSTNIVSLSNKENKLFRNNQFNVDTDEESNSIRFDRLNVRLEKVDLLCNYLKQEEAKEHSFYELQEDSIVNLIIESFEEQKVRIEKSARNNLNMNLEAKINKHGIRLID